MSGEVFELVDWDELEEGWTVKAAGGRFEVARRGGFLRLVDAQGLTWPLSAFEAYVPTRVLPPLPVELGYYKTDEPDHEVIERTSTGWRAIDTVGTPLSDAQVRDMGDLARYVRWSEVAQLEQEWRAIVAAQRVSFDGQIAEARAQVAPAHAAGRAEALAEVWWFLRARGPWWRPVRRAVAGRFGAALVGGGHRG